MKCFNHSRSAKGLVVLHSQSHFQAKSEAVSGAGMGFVVKRTRNRRSANTFKATLISTRGSRRNRNVFTLAQE